jgi:hypothetical protein
LADLRSGLVHHKRPAHKLSAVANTYGQLAILVLINLRKAEPARLARVTVSHQCDRVYGNASLEEPVLQIRFTRLIGEIPHVKLHHNSVSIPFTRSNRAPERSLKRQEGAAGRSKYFTPLKWLWHLQVQFLSSQNGAVKVKSVDCNAFPA